MSADAAGDPAGVVAALRQRSESVAMAESLTGGSLCSALVAIAGSSEVVRGGIVAYAPDLKTALLGVPAELIDRVGTVSAETAAAMAHGGRRRLASTYGLATTGVAGPEPVEGKPVGLVFCACAGPRGVRVRRLELSGDRTAVRTAAVAAGLALLGEWLRTPRE